MPARRIVALVLPELLCELAAEQYLDRSKTRRKSRAIPLAVVLNPERSEARIDAVNRIARRFGVSVGQTVIEANAFLTQLVVCTVTMERVRSALSRVAEVAMQFGSIVSIEPEHESSATRKVPPHTVYSNTVYPNTVWIDITGSAHLRGGERELAEELHDLVRSLGHEASVAIASGKYLAQAFARWSIPVSSRRVLVVPTERTRELLATLPVLALPLEHECASWLVRLGVLSIGDLLALPRKSAVARLGPHGDQVLDLCQGKDEAPLIAYRPERQLVEERCWEQPVSGLEPLIFVLRGLASRLSARLAGRGEAAQVLEVTISLDRSIAKLRETPDSMKLRFELAAPLWKERELLQVVISRIERIRLKAPSIGVRWVVPSITRAAEHQLDLSRALGGKFSMAQGLEALPILLAELNADIGTNNVGILTLNDDHRPEAKSALSPALSADCTSAKPAEKSAARSRREKTPKPRRRRAMAAKTRAQRVVEGPQLRKVSAPSTNSPLAATTPTIRASRAANVVPMFSAVPTVGAKPVTNTVAAMNPLIAAGSAAPTRLLPEPIPFAAPLKVGNMVTLGSQLCSIESSNFECRLEALEWWKRSVGRDYFKVLLKGARGVFEALVFVDLDSGKRYLQAVFD